MSKLGTVAYITKLAGFEHTNFIQGHISHTRDEKYDTPLFIGKTVRDGAIDTNYDWYLPHEISDDLPRSQLNKKCLVMPYVGTVGDIAIFEPNERCHLGSNIAKIELYPDSGYSEEFVYYFMKSPYGQKLLFRDIQGGVQKNITMQAIRDIELPDISMEKQNRVVMTLKNIDDKIANNTNMCVDIEKAAKLLYDFWFIQFDFPDEKGRPYKSSGGKMVWNDVLNREIPLGWDTGTVSDLGAIVGGATPSTKKEEYYVDCGIGWITPNDLSNTTDKFIAHGERDITEEAVASCSTVMMPRGTVIMSSRAPIGYVAIAANDLCTNQGCKSIVPNGHSSEFIYQTLLSMMPYIKRFGVGSTFAEVSKDDLSKMPILIPPIDIEDLYEKEVSSINKKWELLEEENRELSQLRNFLLPMLMNGQVKINDK